MTKNKTIKEIFREIDISGDIATKCNKFRYRLNATEYIYLDIDSGNAKMTRKLILITFNDRYTLIYSSGFFLGIVDNHEKQYYIEATKLELLKCNNINIEIHIKNYLNVENIITDTITSFIKLNFISKYDTLYKTLASWEKPRPLDAILEKIKIEFNNNIEKLKDTIYNYTEATYINKKVDSIYIFIKGVQYRISTHEAFYKTDEQVSNLSGVLPTTIIVNSRYDIINKVNDIKASTL